MSPTWWTSFRRKSNARLREHVDDQAAWERIDDALCQIRPWILVEVASHLGEPSLALADHGRGTHFYLLPASENVSPTTSTVNPIPTRRDLHFEKALARIHHAACLRNEGQTRSFGRLSGTTRTDGTCD